MGFKKLDKAVAAVDVWCVGIEGLGPKLRPKEITSISYGDDWYEERICMLLLFKLIFDVLGDLEVSCS